VGGGYACVQFIVMGSGDLQRIYTWGDGIQQSSILSCAWYTDGAFCSGELSIAIDGLGATYIGSNNVRIPWSD
jgi:hypothetical protein